MRDAGVMGSGACETFITYGQTHALDRYFVCRARAAQCPPARVRSLLGPFLRLSCFPNDAALVRECFGDLTQHHSLESSLSTLRMSLQACTAP